MEIKIGERFLFIPWGSPSDSSGFPFRHNDKILILSAKEDIYQAKIVYRETPKNLLADNDFGIVETTSSKESEESGDFIPFELKIFNWSQTDSPQFSPTSQTQKSALLPTKYTFRVEQPTYSPENKNFYEITLIDKPKTVRPKKALGTFSEFGIRGGYQQTNTEFGDTQKNKQFGNNNEFGNNNKFRNNNKFGNNNKSGDTQKNKQFGNNDNEFGNNQNNEFGNQQKNEIKEDNQKEENIKKEENKNQIENKSSGSPVKKAEWRQAKTKEGRVYYYHTITRQTSWKNPNEKDQENKKEVEKKDQENKKEEEKKNELEEKEKNESEEKQSNLFRTTSSSNRISNSGSDSPGPKRNFLSSQRSNSKTSFSTEEIPKFESLQDIPIFSSSTSSTTTPLSLSSSAEFPPPPPPTTSLPISFPSLSPTHHALLPHLLTFPTTTKTHRFSTHKNVFEGAALVQWLVGMDYVRGREDAVGVGNVLLDAGVFGSVLQKETKFKDQAVLYRFAWHVNLEQKAKTPQKKTSLSKKMSASFFK